MYKILIPTDLGVPSLFHDQASLPSSAAPLSSSSASSSSSTSSFDAEAAASAQVASPHSDLGALTDEGSTVRHSSDQNFNLALNGADTVKVDKGNLKKESAKILNITGDSSRRTPARRNKKSMSSKDIATGGVQQKHRKGPVVGNYKSIKSTEAQSTEDIFGSDDDDEDDYAQMGGDLDWRPTSVSSSASHKGKPSLSSTGAPRAKKSKQ